MALSPARAYADVIDFLGVGRAATVSIGGLRTGTFSAGELNWQWVGTIPEGFARQFYSYCVDVSQNLRDPETVTVRSTEGFTQTPGAPNGGDKAAWLANEYALSVHGLTLGTLDANVKAAALQVAIWEALYDPTHNLAGGNFFLTGNTTLTQSIRTQANIYLNALYGPTDATYNRSSTTLLEVRTPNLGQDQIVAGVSEPSTLLLMGVAFLFFAKRARKQGTPITER